MNKPEEGAFAIQATDDEGWLHAQPGLTKREYFAAAALTGLLAADTEDRRSESNIAFIAVSCADALLAALEGKQSNERV